MIHTQNNVYHLKTECYSYMLRINAYGIPEHLHFGAPVADGDAAAFVCHPGIGWGSCVVLEDSDSGSCLDDKCLEWSGSGRGDYRESPLELGGQSADFRFVGAQTLRGSVPMVCGLPQAKGDCETLDTPCLQASLRVN